MKLFVHKYFEKDIYNITDKKLAAQINKTIVEMEACSPF